MKDPPDVLTPSEGERALTLDRRTAIVFAGVLMLSAAIAGIDALLVRIDHREREHAAESLSQRAQQAAARGDHEQALEYFRMARNERRDEQKYRLNYARALLRAGRTGEAERETRRLLQEWPTDAESNLTLARVLAALEQPEDAVWFYHRALYGNWDERAGAGRVAARLELADLLARRGDTEQLVAEVLLLLNETGEDPQIRRRSADLLLRAGAWDRAAQLYRELLRGSQQNAALHASLGMALFGNGDYRRARNEMNTALRLGHPPEELESQLEVARSVVELDPEARGIGSTERARRSRRLLEIARETAGGCGLAGAAPEDLSAADAQLKQRRPDPDAQLDLAVRLWEHLPAPCRDSVPEARAATILLNHTR